MKNESMAKAIVGVAFSAAIGVAIWVTKSPGPLWAGLIIVMLWDKQ